MVALLSHISAGGLLPGTPTWYTSRSRPTPHTPQVQDVVRDVGSIAATVTAVKEVDLASLQETVASLKKGKGVGSEPSDIDKLFHQRISAVEAKIEGVSNEIKLAVSEMMGGEGWILYG